MKFLSIGIVLVVLAGAVGGHAARATSPPFVAPLVEYSCTSFWGGHTLLVRRDGRGFLTTDGMWAPPGDRRFRVRPARLRALSSALVHARFRTLRRQYRSRIMAADTPTCLVSYRGSSVALAGGGIPRRLAVVMRLLDRIVYANL